MGHAFDSYRWGFALVIGAALAGACTTTSSGNTDDDSSGGNNPGTGGMTSTGGTGNTGGMISTGGMGGTGGGNTGGMGGDNSGGAGGGNTGGAGGTGGGNTGGMGGMGGMGGQGGTPIVNCNTASDCNNAEVCDVTSAQCVGSQCNPALTQPAGCVGTDPICIEQLETSGYGACYEACDPYDQACPGGLECRTNTYGQWFGVCQNPGTGTKGQPCSPAGLDANGWTISSGCVAGHVCLEDGNMQKCYQTCDFFNFGGASCPGAEVCQLGGFCLPPTNDGFENVALEAPCNGATGGEYCGLNGDGYTGSCQDLGDGLGMVCHAFCSADPCPGSTHTECYDVFGPPFTGDVGACSIP